MINKGVSKFVGYMAQLDNNRPSGISIQDMMVRARVAYQDQEDEDVNVYTMTTSDLIRPNDVKKQKERKKRASEAAKVVEGFVSRVELRMEKQDKLLETTSI
ncbi:hypothetical protein IFM89_013124 [Coptis chinensis]|uniref:Uncharacterized protein n=1 Tax=Coptis chinensis TaxID=261450 RepID=A0A835IQL0_9MAGN|nr:hypothetical protein IFM89_013124 [Coptis chinensis]